MVKMSTRNIDIDDKYFNRLEKMIPAYVIALLAAVTRYFEMFEDNRFAQFSVIIIIVISGIITLRFEYTDENKRKRNQALITVFNAMLWVFMVNIYYFDWIEKDPKTLLFMCVTLWVFILPYLFDYRKPDQIENPEISPDETNPDDMVIKWSTPVLPSVTGYKIYRDEEMIKTITETEETKFTDTTRIAGMNHQYQIAAIDRNDAEGPKSGSVEYKKKEDTV
jgi:hypothetical protein